MTEALYPLIEPYEHGILDVGDGNRVYWEACGNPDGKPAVFVHGGPGWGAQPARRQYFDPERYRLIMFDQRGCGRSSPSAADPATDMSHNTTEHLLADMERLRGHLGVERWLMFGGSWGSTLLLAYAQRRPQRVSEIVIAGVTTSRREEIDWLYNGASRFHPEQWERFHDCAAEADRGDGADSDVIAAYTRLMDDPDPEVRARAADAWCAWEDILVSTDPNAPVDDFSRRSLTERLALVRICAHYFGHGAWLEDGALLRDAYRLAGIPGVLIHGRLDLSSPLNTAWELARAWPDAELVVIDDSGHAGSDTMRQRIRGALDAFAGK